MLLRNAIQPTLLLFLTSLTFTQPAISAGMDWTRLIPEPIKQLNDHYNKEHHKTASSSPAKKATQWLKMEIEKNNGELIMVSEPTILLHDAITKDHHSFETMEMEFKLRDLELIDIDKSRFTAAFRNWAIRLSCTETSLRHVVDSGASLYFRIRDKNMYPIWTEQVHSFQCENLEQNL